MRDSQQMAPPAPPAPAASDLFGESSPAVTCAAGVILVLAIAVIDKLTGYDLHLGILYLVPIAMVTWATGRNAGIFQRMQAPIAHLRQEGGVGI